MFTDNSGGNKTVIIWVKRVTINVYLLHISCNELDRIEGVRLNDNERYSRVCKGVGIPNSMRRTILLISYRLILLLYRESVETLL